MPCFDFETCSTYVYSMKPNATNKSINTGNVEIMEVFKNYTTIIETNYIAIHIDIELFSCPKYNHTKVFCIRRK